MTTPTKRQLAKVVISVEEVDKGLYVSVVVSPDVLSRSHARVLPEDTLESALTRAERALRDQLREGV